MLAAGVGLALSPVAAGPAAPDAGAPAAEVERSRRCPRPFVGRLAPAPPQALGAARYDDAATATISRDARRGSVARRRRASTCATGRSTSAARRRRCLDAQRAHRPRAAAHEQRVRPALRGVPDRGHAGRHRLRQPRRPLSTRTSWSVEAAAAQGAVSSWFVGGTYATVIADSHGVDVRSSYSRQRYDGGNPAALAAFADGSRNVGGVQVMDHWTLSPRALITYGGRYEHYDYLQRPGLFSPTITVVAVAGGAHLGARHGRAADDRAGRRGVRAAGLRQPGAAAAAHVRAARRRRRVRPRAHAPRRRRARARRRVVAGRRSRTSASTSTISS